MAYDNLLSILYLVINDPLIINERKIYVMIQFIMNVENNSSHILKRFCRILKGLTNDKITKKY